MKAKARVKFEDEQTNGCIEQALDVAADAILRRARVLEGQDADVAERLRVLVLNLDPRLCLREGE